MRSSCFGFAKESGQAKASAWSETDSKKNEASLIACADGLKNAGKRMGTFLSSPERPVKNSGKVSWLRRISTRRAFPSF
jgi:hypothetical protein